MVLSGDKMGVSCQVGFRVKTVYQFEENEVQDKGEG